MFLSFPLFLFRYHNNNVTMMTLITTIPTTQPTTTPITIEEESWPPVCTSPVAIIIAVLGVDIIVAVLIVGIIVAVLLVDIIVAVLTVGIIVAVLKVGIIVAVLKVGIIIAVLLVGDIVLVVSIEGNMPLLVSVLIDELTGYMAVVGIILLVTVGITDTVVNEI